VNNYEWAWLLLADAELPAVATNVDNVVRWMAAENPPEDWWRKYDPLNAFDFTGPTQGFPTLEQGAIATARVLLQSNMAPIANALRASSSLAVFSAACHEAPWAIPDRYGSALFIASIPLPTVVEAPGTTVITPAPKPVPKPLPPEVPMPVLVTNGETVYIIWPNGTKTGVTDPQSAATWQKFWGPPQPVSTGQLGQFPTVEVPA
jgi:hypothetical protein